MKTIQGARFSHLGLRFRPVAESDLEDLRRLRNHPSTRSQLTDDKIISRAAQRRWYQSVQKNNSRAYFVVSSDLHPFIGIVRMDEFDRRNKSIRVGADVVPELRGRGLGRAIFSAIKNFCFRRLMVNRVWLAVLETNEHAYRLYKKQGFKLEGKYRKAIFRKGRFIDYLIMSILRGEYRP